MSKARARCAVVTFFAEGQPGFLDFAYRINAISENFETTVVSNLSLDRPEFEASNFTSVHIPRNEGQGGWLRYIWQCSSWLKRENWDCVVLLHSAVSPIALLYKSSPVVLYWNEHPTHLAPPVGHFSLVKGVVRALLRRMVFEGAKASDLVMPIGEAHRDDLLRHGCDPRKLSLIYMGASSSFRTARPPSDSSVAPPLRILYVGSVSEERGRDVMLEGMALANREGARTPVHLKIVGASKDQQLYCQKKIADLGIQDQVEVVGRVAGTEVPAFFEAADMGICLWEDKPWYRFNPPTKLFEYLVAGLPVLASRIRTHTEYIKDGENGLIFEYGAEGFADAIRRLAGNSAMLAGMKQQAWIDGEEYLWPSIEETFIKELTRLKK